MSALFNFQSLLSVILLLICTCAYLRSFFPSIMDRKKTGYVIVFAYCGSNLYLKPDQKYKKPGLAALLSIIVDYTPRTAKFTVRDCWERFGNVQELVKENLPTSLFAVLLWHFPYFSSHNT